MMNPEIKQRWLKALRSGEYKQARDRLEDTTRGENCCLGVLARCLGRNPYEVDAKSVFNAGSSEKLSSLFLDEVGLLEGEQLKLTQMNDALDEARIEVGFQHKWSFARIADWIEKAL